MIYLAKSAITNRLLDCRSGEHTFLTCILPIVICNASNVRCLKGEEVRERYESCNQVSHLIMISGRCTAVRVPHRTHTIGSTQLSELFQVGDRVALRLHKSYKALGHESHKLSNQRMTTIHDQKTCWASCLRARQRT